MDDAIHYPPEFESGLREGTLPLPHCRACARFHWYPLARCPYCLSPDIEWTKTQGQASVFTCSTVQHAFEASWSDAIPYTVALIEFSDAPGIRLVAQLLEAQPGATRVGAVVEPVFLLGGKAPRVVFQPVAEHVNECRESS